MLDNQSHGPARLLSAGAVLLLHGVLLLALLRANPGQAPQPRESTLWLPLQADTHPPATKPSRKMEQRPQRPPNRTAPSAQPPNAPVFSLPTEADQKNLLGLRDLLINCAPENFAALDDTQRSRCRNIGAYSRYDPGAVDWADHTDQVPGAKRWERELARKQAPLLLPCGNPKAADPVYTGACIIENIANGFTFKTQYENQPAYFDRPGKPAAKPP